MSRWKEAPVPETEDSGWQSHLPDLSLNWDWVDPWASITILGFEVPTAAFVLPVAILLLYLAFASSARANERRLKARRAASQAEESEG